MTPQAARGFSPAGVVKDLFGAKLDDKGRGFYVALELFALVRGRLDLDKEPLPEETGEPLEIYRRTHDFSRRLAGAPCALSDEERAWLGTEQTFDTLQSLIVGLLTPLPGRRRRPKWLGEHLFPYVGDLVHYDAAQRGSRISAETYAYRGAGGLAHKILRTDHDSARLKRNRAGLLELIENSRGPLGHLFRVLSEQDKGSGNFVDNEEHRATFPKESVWVENLRSGVSNICGRKEIPVAKRVEACMHWVPYCIARLQLEVAESSLGKSPRSLPVAFVQKAGVIRRVARLALDRSHGVIKTALLRRAEEMDAEAFAQLKSRAWLNDCRAFFSQTLGTVGALNAMTGRRFFSYGPEILEATVMATIAPKEEVTFEVFCQEILARRLCLTVDSKAAFSSSQFEKIDRTKFDENEECAAEALRELGLLRDYSDMTKMVSGESQ
jgi:hypothetical protein